MDSLLLINAVSPCRTFERFARPRRSSRSALKADTPYDKYYVQQIRSVRLQPDWSSTTST